MTILPKRLIDILSTDEFLVSIFESSKLSGAKESSFRVYGDRESYGVNEPMEEESTSCMVGVGDHGVVYHVEGKGLYLPHKKSSIIDVHFHPKGSIAMPSPTDFGGTFSDYINNRRQSFSDSVHADFKYFVPTSIVGLKSKKEIDLFIYQPRDLEDDFDPENFHEIFDSKFRDEKGTLVLSHKGEPLPKRFAKELELTEKYFAINFSFSKKADYLENIKKLRKFRLMGDIIFKDYPEDFQMPVPPKVMEDFSLIDFEEELRRERFF